MKLILRHDQRLTNRTGVTLLELMLVLVLLIVVAGLAMPIFTGMARAARLRNGADQIRAAMAQARVRAITSGQIFALRYDLNAGTYTTSPYSQFIDANEASSEAQLVTESRSLPEGVRFFAGNSVTDNRSTLAAREEQAAEEPAVLFYPDGTTSTAELQINNEEGSALVIALRGMTGTSIVSDVQSQSQDQSLQSYAPGSN